MDNTLYVLLPGGVFLPCDHGLDFDISLLRAKRASNLQGASFFLGCIKKIFPLGYLEMHLIGQWIQGSYWPVARVCIVPFGRHL